jgi:hypothetical protein
MRYFTALVRAGLVWRYVRDGTHPAFCGSSDPAERAQTQRPEATGRLLRPGFGRVSRWQTHATAVLVALREASRAPGGGHLYR